MTRTRTQEAKQAINSALELFQRRWSLRVLWELRDEAQTFRALQTRCDEISPTVLNQRLAELRDAGLLASGADGYALTAIGRELLVAFAPFTTWAVKWQRERNQA